MLHGRATICSANIIVWKTKCRRPHILFEVKLPLDVSLLFLFTFDKSNMITFCKSPSRIEMSKGYNYSYFFCIIKKKLQCFVWSNLQNYHPYLYSSACVYLLPHLQHGSHLKVFLSLIYWCIRHFYNHTQKSVFWDFLRILLGVHWIAIYSVMNTNY